MECARQFYSLLFRKKTMKWFQQMRLRLFTSFPRNSVGSSCYKEVSCLLFELVHQHRMGSPVSETVWWRQCWCGLWWWNKKKVCFKQSQERKKCNKIQSLEKKNKFWVSYLVVIRIKVPGCGRKFKFEKLPIMIHQQFGTKRCFWTWCLCWEPEIAKVHHHHHHQSHQTIASW